jgi:hypothetical protein
VDIQHAAARLNLAHTFGEEPHYLDPQDEQVAAEWCEAAMTACHAAAAAIPASDWVARRTAMLEEFLAQSQLRYGAVYLMQKAYGVSDPFGALPLSNLPENMQPHYRAALQRAADGAETGSAASICDDAGYTGDDSDTDSGNDSDADSDADSGNDEQDEN